MKGKAVCLKVRNNCQVAVCVLSLCSTNLESSGALAGISIHRWILFTYVMAQTLLQARQWSVNSVCEQNCGLCIAVMTQTGHSVTQSLVLMQCFPTAGPRPGTGPWHQLYRAARGKCFYSGNILRRIIFVKVSKSSDPERLNNICVANGSDQAAYC
jgi:hypothetical protein